MNHRNWMGLFLALALVATGYPATWAQSSTADTAAAAASPRHAGDEFESLFDGKTLEGWSGAAGLWRVEDGAIVGESTAEAPLPHNTFLIWTGGELEDFELRIRFRIESGNSGIQFRSRDFGDFKVGGYQADLEAGETYTGIIYEERGRGILCQRGKRVDISESGERKVSDLDFDAAEFLEKVRAGEWNEFVVRAQGGTIRQSINGIATAELHDYETDKAASRGILALQLHAGPPMKVMFKDIRLKNLNRE